MNVDEYDETSGSEMSLHGVICGKLDVRRRFNTSTAEYIQPLRMIGWRYVTACANKFCARVSTAYEPVHGGPTATKTHDVQCCCLCIPAIFGSSGLAIRAFFWGCSHIPMNMQ